LKRATPSAPLKPAMDTNSYADFFSEFMGETDRAAIVLGAAQMDALLEAILKARLIEPKKDLFAFQGPFGTFSGKIETASVVGAIDRSFANKLHLVRNIRNACAHDVRRVQLDTGGVAQQIDDLSKAFSDTPYWEESRKQAGQIFEKTGNSLTLRFAIALLVANLALALNNVPKIDGRTAHRLILSKPTAKPKKLTTDK